MHPEIIKFWERAGFTIAAYHTSDLPGQIVWFKIKDDKSYGVAAFIGVGGLTRYFIDDSHYSEEEMLKLIKLKAFM